MPTPPPSTRELSAALLDAPTVALARRLRDLRGVCERQARAERWAIEAELVRRAAEARAAVREGIGVAHGAPEAR